MGFSIEKITVEPGGERAWRLLRDGREIAFALDAATIAHTALSCGATPDNCGWPDHTAGTKPFGNNYPRSIVERVMFKQTGAPERPPQELIYKAIEDGSGWKHFHGDEVWV